MSGGAGQGYATAISHGLGVALYAAITATGIGIIIVKSPMLFSIIQYTGAAFLLYLGVSALINSRVKHDNNNVDKSHDSAVESAEANVSKVNGWRDGFLIAFLNPKLAIFFLALFSQFVDANAAWLQKVIMTATVGIIDMAWYVIVAYGLSRGAVIEKLKANSHIVDRVTGTFLVLLAARVVWN